MNGLGYPDDGGKTFGLAMIMNGSIVVDYVNMSVFNADVIRVGVLKDVSGNSSLNMKTGTLTMKKGLINIGGNSIVDEQGNLTARRGTFTGMLVTAKNPFGGVVQVEDFLDPYGNSMLTDDEFKADYLDLYGLTVNNKGTGAVTFAVSSNGFVTINGSVTVGVRSSINWAQVSSQDINSNPAYSMTNGAYNLADEAYDYIDDTYSQADRAYRLADSIEMPGYIKSIYIDQTAICSPIIEGGEFHGEEFNITVGSDFGSFNFYGPYGNSRFHMLAIEYYEEDTPYIDIYSSCGNYITIGNRSNGGTVFSRGHVDFSGVTVRGLDFGTGE